MECSKPGTIRDEELIACLAGEQIRPVVIEHLAECERCSYQLATYKRMDHRLFKKLYRWDCPPSQVLGEYQMGLLQGNEVAWIKNHLNMCVSCAAEVTVLTEFLANDPMLVESIPVPQVSVSARSFQNNHHPVQDAKRTLEELRERTLAGARRIIATLVPPQPRLAFQRDVTQLPVWPRLYTAEDLNISIQAERGLNRRDALQLIGLVTRKGAALEALQGTSVQLMTQENAVYTQVIDELGNFVFSSVAPGTYTLELQLAEGVVVVDQLAVMPQE